MIFKLLFLEALGMRLFCPGPVNLHPKVSSLELHQISHRGKDFQNLLVECTQKTKQLFSISDVSYTPLFLTGSGTLAIESMIVSYKGKGRVLLLQNGFFAEKWEAFFQNHGVDYSTLSFGWENPFSYESIRRVLTESHFHALFFVHHETSTTRVNDIISLNKLCVEFHLDLLVDGVSSVGMYPIHIPSLESLCMIAYSTNKCIGSYPGLAVVIGKTTFLESLSETISYLNLYQYYKFSLQNETPFTPCVQNFMYYKKALECLFEETQRYDVYKERCEYFIAECRNMGLAPYISNPKEQCCWVVNISCKFPDELYNFLYNHTFIIYKCKGVLQNTHVQIAFLNKSKEDIDDLFQLIRSFYTTKAQVGLVVHVES
jgi:2-aminoethylphosphonate-pyruvate transaminase